MAEFLVLSLPRSRSAWLAHFLGANHDAAVLSDSGAEFLNAVDQGTVETGSQIAFGYVKRERPEAKIVVVRRPVGDVLRSLADVGVSGDGIEAEIHKRAADLDRISAFPGVKTLSYSDLDDAFTCSWLFEYLTSKPLTPEWWNQVSKFNIQVDVRKRLELVASRSEQIEKLKELVNSVPFPDEPRSGVVIALEPFASMWPEFGLLASKHFREVESPSENSRPYKLNTMLMDMANKLGHMPMLSARVDGRLAGYLTWNLMQDIECSELKTAHQGAWYVSPEYKALGLGWKLLRAGLKMLTEAGIDEVFLHHRLSGRARDLSVLFRRLKAVPIQSTYYLKLKD